MSEAGKYTVTDDCMVPQVLQPISYLSRTELSLHPLLCEGPDETPQHCSSHLHSCLRYGKVNLLQVPLPL